MRKWFLGFLIGIVIWSMGLGSVLAAPPIPPVPPAVPVAGRYQVRWGDSMSRIAARFGTTVSVLARANGISNPDRIYAGQWLLIPGAVPVQPTPRVHVVSRGETLSAIAVRYRATVSALVRANGIWNPNLIYLGQRLVIP